MHVTPASLGPKLKLLEEGLARRGDGKTLADLEIAGIAQISLTDDVRSALDAAKPTIALYVGGMGAKQKNFHKDAMIARGYAAEADRIQELFLAGHKEEAAAAIPDEYIDEGALIGPEARIAESYAKWRDSAFTLIRLGNPDLPALEAMARIAARD
jgi:hypothetical protein